MKKSGNPVFYSESPKRWKAFIGTIRVAVVVLLMAVIIVFVTIFRSSGSILPKINDLNEVYKRILNPERIGTFETTQNRSYKNARAKLASKPDFNYQKKFHSKPSISKPLQKQIRSAFYVNWDAQSYHSLKENIDKLNMVMPEWFFISAGSDTVITDIDSHALLLMRNNKIPVIPMLSNYYHDKWDGSAVHKFISSPAKRKALIDNLINLLGKNKFQGINIDFETLTESKDEDLSEFQKELYEAFHKKGLIVTQDIPPFNTDYNLKDLSKCNDYVVLMAYDLHYETSKPGPVSPINWVEEAVVNVLKFLPSEKLIVSIPTYGYDWPDGDVGNDITFEEAVVTAKESEGEIDFDNDYYNLDYEYYDDNDHRHQVWFSDAATCFNTMRLAADYNAAGVTLWRLGGEDKRIWKFYKMNLSKDSLAVSKINTGGLTKIYPGTDVEFQGEGDILKLVSVPDSGLIDITYDDKEQLITDQDYVRMPTSYFIKKFGKADKKVVLSFDDGPDEKYTPEILDILKEQKIHAEFFVIGLNAENNLNVLKRIYDEGHEIGNHSFSHPNLAEINPERAAVELNTTRRIIESVTGHTTMLFRPPYNADSEPQSYDDIMPIVIASKQNYLTVAESIDPRDWEAGISVDSIMSRIKVQENYGNILLLHDAGGNREATIKALPLIIKYFRDKGYTFTTVSELLGKSRDEVMPLLKNQDDIYFSKFNWVIAEIIYWIEHLLASLFIAAIILGIGRTFFMALLSFIEKKRSKKEVRELKINSLISIIVPAYNEEVNAVSTISNLLKSDYENIEIVFVDDGSKDDTYSKVCSAFEGNNKVRVFTKPNGGKASALNYGISVANGEYLVCIDADTQLKKNAITELLKCFNDDNVGAAAGNVKVGNTINLITTWQSIEYITSQNFDRRAFGLLNCITVVPGAIGAFRKSAVIEVGKFSTDTLAEDCELTIRLLRAGYKIKFSNKAIAYTEAPETLRMFLKQRFRWTYGIMQSVWKNRDEVFSTAHKGLGFVAIPNAIIFQFIMPLLTPLIDLLLIFSLISGHWWQTFLFYVVFTVVDLIAAVFAFSYENENILKLWYLIPQRIVYRQLMFWVLCRSYIAAVRGTLIGWGVLKRTGNVAVNN
jgi:cellulose synthase/poly-beta-1,6-N-acetylglucosamine synthase-like glycosyltransferase/spore germination protein YaaH/peptidoglycan/xylan/chitin deacetylase (PgdA/CDA1 family)